MQTVSPLVLAAGLALVVATPALADPPAPAGKRTDLRVERASMPRGGLGSPRGQQFPLGSFVTMRDELENFPLDTSFGGTGVSAEATSFTGPEGFVWPLNNLRGQSSVNFVHMIDLSGAPVSGPNGVTNASKALRIFTATAQPASGFFTGANLRFGGQSGEPTLPLEPLPGFNARVSAEHWLSSIDSLYTFEPVAVFTGFIVGRLMWGGTCVEADPGDCTDVGLPIGPLTHFVVLAEYCSIDVGDWLPATYCEN